MEKFKSLFKETHQFIDEVDVTAWKSNLPKKFDISGQCSSLDGENKSQKKRTTCQNFFWGGNNLENAE